MKRQQRYASQTYVPQTYVPQSIAPAPAHVAPSAATGAIRAAFMASRSGHNETRRHRRNGSLDGRALHRVASFDGRVCKSFNAPSPQHWRVWLMIDVSSSMRNVIAECRDVASALVRAAQFVPSIEMEVFAWSDPFVYDPMALTSKTFGIVRLWTHGAPLSDLDYLPSIPMGNTPDAEMMAWTVQEMPKHIRPRERGLVIVASDGSGNDPREMQRQIMLARKSGLTVISVALGGVNVATQQYLYGPKSYVQWRGSITETARPLAQMLARIVA